MNPFVQEIAHFVSQHTPLDQTDVRHLIEVPKDPAHGDYAFPCFSLAKTLRKAPAAIAAQLAKTSHPWEYVETLNPMGPYVNFTVNRTRFVEVVLGSIQESGSAYGDSDLGKGKVVVADFSSPNLFKPFAVHHLRSTAIGHALCNTYEALGYSTVKVNHLGDWGTPFGKIMVAYDRWGDQEALQAHPTLELFRLYVKFEEQAQEDDTLNEEARQRFSRLERGDPQVVSRWESLRASCLKELGRTYEMLEIHFDSWAGESFYRDMLDDLIQSLVDSGLAVQSEGALVVNLDDYDLPPFLLRKRDEASLYQTRDLAAALYRHRHYGFDKLIYVTDSGQSLYFRQLFKVLELMGEDWVGQAVHVPFGLLNFKGGKMSTRQGNVILLEDVLNRSVELTRAIIEEKNPGLEGKDRVARDVGIGAVIFADLSSRRNKNIEFDWEEVLNFNGETGPYIQYTHARFCSVLRKRGQSGLNQANLGLLGEEAEYAVVKTLERLPATILAAAEAFEPSLIAGYLLELCAQANRFYNGCRVLGDDEALTRARVALTYCITVALRKGLSLLGMKAPERM